VTEAVFEFLRRTGVAKMNGAGHRGKVGQRSRAMRSGGVDLRGYIPEVYLVFVYFVKLRRAVEVGSHS
jgi:hypothetical protein